MSVNCPYCQEEVEVDHHFPERQDEEATIECGNCERFFQVTVDIRFRVTATCEGNNEDHEWERIEGWTASFCKKCNKVRDD